jgi:MFS transporter, ACS family, tartrate transporter
MQRSAVTDQYEKIGSTADVEQRAFAKIAWRYVPILTLGFLLNHLDRNNIGFAALQMNQEIGLTATQFGIGAGILFLGYCFFELPSNLLLYRVAARAWLSRIMITWGLASAAMIFVTGPKSWYVLRFVLGTAEAGFFPGVAFYVSSWFPKEYRTRMLAWFLVAIPASVVFGGPVSGILLGMDGIGGLAGWKWLFLLEGVPTVLLGIVFPWVLANRPEEARWLTAEEQRVVVERIQSEKREREMRHLLPALKDARVLLLAGIFFGFTVGSYGIGIWLPQIVKGQQLSNMTVGFITAGCYALACIGMVAWAAYVDRKGTRIRNLLLTFVASAAGLVLAIFFQNFWLSLAWMTVGLVGINAARSVFWVIPTQFLTGIASAGGLAFINAVGTAGGFFGPFIMGWLKDLTGSFNAGLVAMAGFLILAAALTGALKLFVREE